MTNERKPVLLTEAEWHALLGLAYKHAEPALRQRGLIAPEVDPLLIEAREIVAGIWEAEDREAFARFYRNGVHPENRYMRTALAALKRGMELAKPELTREMVREAIHEGQRRMHGGTGTVSESFLEGVSDALHAALTEQVRK